MPDDKKTEDTIPQTFEEKYAKEISERTAAGLPIRDAIAVQKAQIQEDQRQEEEEARRTKENKDAKKKAN